MSSFWGIGNTFLFTSHIGLSVQLFRYFPRLILIGSPETLPNTVQNPDSRELICPRSQWVHRRARRCRCGGRAVSIDEVSQSCKLWTIWCESFTFSFISPFTSAGGKAFSTHLQNKISPNRHSKIYPLHYMGESANSETSTAERGIWRHRVAHASREGLRYCRRYS